MEILSSSAHRATSKEFDITISNKTLGFSMPAKMQIHVEHIGLPAPATYEIINGCPYYEAEDVMRKMLRELVGYDPKKHSNGGFTVCDGMYGYLIAGYFFAIMPNSEFRKIQAHVISAMPDRY